MTVVTIEDLRTRAKARLPRAIFDYIDGGAGDEATLIANRAAFSSVTFQPRCLVDISNISQRTTVLGQQLESPLLLAPVGLSGLAARNGEIAAARAARAEGVGFTLSTMSVNSVEDVSAATDGDIWFQLYVMRDRGLTEALIQRAREARCSALVLTVDVPIHGPRERDVRNGLSIPPRITVRNIVDMARRLPWIMDVMMGPRLSFGNFQAKGDSIVAGAAYVAQTMDPTITWQDVAWFKSIWGGPLVIKGILNPEDARMALEHGADAIIVSNHGGRQLDGASSSLAALPAIVDAVEDRMEVLLDGGIRRGADVVKALALGARACLIGRPFAYGLAAGGQAGAAQAIQILKREITTAMGLLGVTEVSQLGAHNLIARPASQCLFPAAPLDGIRQPPVRMRACPPQ